MFDVLSDVMYNVYSSNMAKLTNMAKLGSKRIHCDSSGSLGIQRALPMTIQLAQITCNWNCQLQLIILFCILNPFPIICCIAKLKALDPNHFLPTQHHIISSSISVETYLTNYFSMIIVKSYPFMKQSSGNDLSNFYHYQPLIYTLYFSFCFIIICICRDNYNRLRSSKKDYFCGRIESNLFCFLCPTSSSLLY